MHQPGEAAQGVDAKPRARPGLGAEVDCLGLQVDRSAAEPGDLGKLGHELFFRIRYPVLDVESHNRADEPGLFLVLFEWIERS